MKLTKAIFYLFLPVLLGTLIGILTSDSINYTNLIKPPLAPSGIIFPIVWTILYLLMGLSYFIFKRNEEDTKLESIVYYSQLIVNILWSVIFFNLQWRFFAIIWIILLDVLVALMIYLFYRKNKISAYLNIPYMIWIIFATYLTIGIYILN